MGRIAWSKNVFTPPTMQTRQNWSVANILKTTENCRQLCSHRRRRPDKTVLSGRRRWCEIGLSRQSSVSPRPRVRCGYDVGLRCYARLRGTGAGCRTSHGLRIDTKFWLGNATHFRHEEVNYFPRRFQKLFPTWFVKQFLF